MEIVDNYYYTPNFNSVDWKYKYWAIDWDGRAFFYEEEPSIINHKDCWDCWDEYKSLRLYDYQFDYFVNYFHIKGQMWKIWRESLIIKGKEGSNMITVDFVLAELFDDMEKWERSGRDCIKSLVVNEKTEESAEISIIIKGDEGLYNCRVTIEKPELLNLGRKNT